MSNGWRVFGHDWAVESLRTAVIHGRIGHAYLFTGPAQVGRRTLALRFAQALNCESAYPESRPCGVCRPCQLIETGKHPDVRLVEPELNARGRGIIKIEQVRALQKELNLGSYEGRYKVAILADFDAANPSAANAFLKTLEEPPPNVVLILTASEADAMLPTINSRCRTLNLRPLPVAQVAQVLVREKGIPTAEAELLAHLSNGRIGWALQAQAEPAVLARHQEQIGLLNEALGETRVGRFALAEKLAKKTETLEGLLQTWLGWWRDVLVLTHGRGQMQQLINIDQREALTRYAETWTADQTSRGLTQTKLALWQLERNVNVRLLLENLFLAYPLQM